MTSWGRLAGYTPMNEESIHPGMYLLRVTIFPLVSRTFSGPAIIEQLDATTVIEPGDRVAVDPLGNLIVTVAPGESR